jgi:hypothetical protein
MSLLDGLGGQTPLSSAKSSSDIGGTSGSVGNIGGGGLGDWAPLAILAGVLILLAVLFTRGGKS